MNVKIFEFVIGNMHRRSVNVDIRSLHAAFFFHAIAESCDFIMLLMLSVFIL